MKIAIVIIVSLYVGWKIFDFVQRKARNKAHKDLMKWINNGT